MWPGFNVQKRKGGKKKNIESGLPLLAGQWAPSWMWFWSKGAPGRQKSSERRAQSAPSWWSAERGPFCPLADALTASATLISRLQRNLLWMIFSTAPLPRCVKLLGPRVKLYTARQRNFSIIHYSCFFFIFDRRCNSSLHHTQENTDGRLRVASHSVVSSFFPRESAQ